VAIIEESVHRLSTEEYERIVATGALAEMRVELLDGLLVDMSPQGADHARAIHRLMLLFARRLEVLRVQMPLAVAEGWVPEPDLALAEYGPAGSDHPSTALFVAEVSVTSQRVDTTKALVYARAGIPVYWLVDLPAAAVCVHTQPGPGGYASVVSRSGGDVLDAGVEGVDATTAAALLGL
jgi:Uma2 family endonuclease